MITRQLEKIGITLLLMLCSHFAIADVVLIVNPEIGISSISKKEAKRIFLGKTKKIKSKSLIAVDQKEGNTSRSVFYEKVVKKSEFQLKSYWSTMIFSGKGTPPKSLDSDDKVRAWVSNNPDAIGYIDSSKVDRSVVVIYTVK